MQRILILLCFSLIGLSTWQFHHIRVEANNSLLDKPVAYLTKAELKKFVELGFAEKISVEQATILYEQLNQTQKEIVSKLVAEQAGIPIEQWERESHPPNKSF